MALVSENSNSSTTGTGVADLALTSGALVLAAVLCLKRLNIDDVRDTLDNLPLTAQQGVRHQHL